MKIKRVEHALEKIVYAAENRDSVMPLYGKLSSLRNSREKTERGFLVDVIFGEEILT